MNPATTTFLALFLFFTSIPGRATTTLVFVGSGKVYIASESLVTDRYQNRLGAGECKCIVANRRAVFTAAGMLRWKPTL